MKRFLSGLLLFSVVGVILYMVLVIVVGSFAPDRYKKNLKYALGRTGNLYTRIKQADTVKNVDVLVVGSSHAYRGYDPRVFAQYGVHMFNLGSSGQSMMQTEVLLNQYLDRIKPKLVLFDIYPEYLCSSAIESALDVVSNDHVDAQVLGMAFKLNNIEVYNTLIYSYFRQKAGLNKNFVEATSHGKDSYISGGYVQSLKVSSPEDHKATEPYKYLLNNKQVEALHRIAELLKERKMPYVFVQSPLPVKHYARITNNAEVDSLVSGLGTYYNFNKLMTVPDSLFADGNHLNQWGVQKYNPEVLKQLKLGKASPVAIN